MCKAVPCTPPSLLTPAGLPGPKFTSGWRHGALAQGYSRALLGIPGLGIWPEDVQIEKFRSPPLGGSTEWPEQPEETQGYPGEPWSDPRTFPESGPGSHPVVHLDSVLLQFPIGSGKCLISFQEINFVLQVCRGGVLLHQAAACPHS